MNEDLNQRLLQSSEYFLSKEFEFHSKDAEQIFSIENIRNKSSFKLFQSICKHEDILKILKTDANEGLDLSSDWILESRKKTFGENLPLEIRIKGIFELIYEEIREEVLILLLIAATISLVIGIWREGIITGWIDAISIYIAVFIVVSVGSINNYLIGVEYRKLQETRFKRDITVIRNKNVQLLPVNNLLVGDIMILNIGEIMPVDALLISGSNIMVDESSITGESSSEYKTPNIGGKDIINDSANPFLFSGSKILEGTGKCIALAVGKNTWMNRLLNYKKSKDEKTSLQKKLKRIVFVLSIIGIISAILTIIAISLNQVRIALIENQPIFSSLLFKKFINILILGFAIIDVAIPEGLPLAVTLCFALSINKMKNLNNLVKKLKFCETMGGANNILTDKTGTLTKNEMAVASLFIEGKEFEIVDNQTYNVCNLTMDLLGSSICENSTSFYLDISNNSEINCNLKSLDQTDTKDYETIQNNNKISNIFEASRKYNEKSMNHSIGNPTEIALLKFIYQFGYSCKNFRNPEDEILIIPFTSNRKKMIKVTKIKSNFNPNSNSNSNTNLNEEKYRVYVKGAPDSLKGSIRYIIKENGLLSDISSDQEELNHIIDKFSQAMYRCILVAYKDWDIEEFKKSTLNLKNEQIENILEKDLILIAIIGLTDPLRNDVKETVEIFKNAGINVRMITGDDKQTAVNIALKCGILSTSEIDKNSKFFKPYAVMTGSEFSEYIKGNVKENDISHLSIDERKSNNPQFNEKRKLIISQLKVLARSLPEDKYKLVEILKEDPNNVIAVTGDGTNDAPALYNSDIGFAMGISGTEMAKEAAGIILLDDNFKSIVYSLQWGRNIYLNIKRFLQFHLTVSLVALFIVLMCGILISESPLTTVQLLWIDLIMDSLAALAFATEHPTESILHEKPYSKKEFIVSSEMIINILTQGIFQIIVIVILIYFPRELFDIEPKNEFEEWNLFNGKHFTIIFHIIVLMQFFNELNCRTLQLSARQIQINIFKGIAKNYTFISILFVTILIQYSMICFGKEILKCSPLTIRQHLLCIGISSFSFIIHLLSKLLIFIFLKNAHLNENKQNEEINILIKHERNDLLHNL